MWAGPTELETGLRRKCSKRLDFSLGYKYLFFHLEEVRNSVHISFLKLSFSLPIVETQFLEDLPFYPTKSKSLW